MAKSKAREYAWLQCAGCDSLNYRTEIKVVGGTPKLALKKYCKVERKHTDHKLKRK
jgi:large subunit ribosomal protein L33